MKTAWSKINYKPGTERAKKNNRTLMEHVLEETRRERERTKKHRRLCHILSDIAFNEDDFLEKYQEMRSLVKELGIDQKGMKCICTEPARIAAVMRNPNAN